MTASPKEKAPQPLSVDLWMMSCFWLMLIGFRYLPCYPPLKKWRFLSRNVFLKICHPENDCLPRMNFQVEVVCFSVLSICLLIPKQSSVLSQAIPGCNPIAQVEIILVSLPTAHTVDETNPAPAEVGSLSHYSQGFFGTSQVVDF